MELAADFASEDDDPEETLVRCSPLLEEMIYDDLLKLKSFHIQTISSLDTSFLVNATMRIIGANYYLSLSSRAVS